MVYAQFGGSLFTFFLSVLGLLSKRSYAALKASAILALLFGIFCLAEGFLFLWILRYNFQEIFAYFGADVQVNELFFTYGYIPVIPIAALQIAFWCVCGLMREERGRGTPYFLSEYNMPTFRP